MTMRNITLVSNFVMNLICLAIMLAGLLIAFSPFYLEAGLVGWYQGFKFDPASNILGLQSLGWLVCNVLSFLLGAAIAIAAGFMGIGLGISSAIFRIASQRQNADAALDPKHEIEFLNSDSQLPKQPPAKE